jgi:hypothetical protein
LQEREKRRQRKNNGKQCEEQWKQWEIRARGQRPAVAPEDRQQRCARVAAGQIESQHSGMSLGAIPTLLFMPLAQIENAHNNEIKES